MKKIWEHIKAAWEALVARIKRLLKRDAPRLKCDVGGRVYINGAPYIIVGINMDMLGHVDFQVEPEAKYYTKRMVELR